LELETSESESELGNGLAFKDASARAMLDVARRLPTGKPTTRAQASHNRGAARSSPSGPRKTSGKKARQRAKRDHLVAAFTAASTKSPEKARLRSQVAAATAATHQVAAATAALQTPGKASVTAQEAAEAASASAAAALNRIFNNIRHIRSLDVKEVQQAPRQLRFELDAEAAAATRTRIGDTSRGAVTEAPTGSVHSTSTGTGRDDNTPAGRSLLLSLPTVSVSETPSPNNSHTSTKSPDSLCSTSVSPRPGTMSRLGQRVLSGREQERHTAAAGKIQGRDMYVSEYGMAKVEASGALQEILGKTPELKDEDKNLLASIEDLLMSHLGSGAKREEKTDRRARGRERLAMGEGGDAGAVERGLERLQKAAARSHEGDAPPGARVASSSATRTQLGDPWQGPMTDLSDGEYIYDSDVHAPSKAGRGKMEAQGETSSVQNARDQAETHPLQKTGVPRQSSEDSIGDVLDACPKDVTLFHDMDLQYLLSSQGGLRGDEKVDERQAHSLSHDVAESTAHEAFADYHGKWGDVAASSRDRAVGTTCGGGGVGGSGRGGYRERDGGLKLAAHGGSDGRPPRAPPPPPAQPSVPPPPPPPVAAPLLYTDTPAESYHNRRRSSLNASAPPRREESRGREGIDDVVEAREELVTKVRP